MGERDGGSLPADDGPRTPRRGRRRWPRVLAVCVLGLALLVPVSAVGAVYATQRRDEGAYLAYLHRYAHGPAWRQIWATKSPSWVIAEGDRSCDWLRRQPYAGLRTQPRYRFEALYARWHRWAAATSDPLWTAPNRGREDALYSLVGISWETLCPADWVLHKPHYLLEPASQD